MNGTKALLLTGMLVLLLSLLSANCAAQAGPDMEVRDLTTQPIEEKGIYGGMAAKVFANITNNGTMEAQNVTITFYVGVGGGDYDELRQHRHDGAFPRGLTLQYEAVWPVDDNKAEGDRLDNLKVEVTANDETQPNDNEEEITVRVRPNTPDLAVELATDFPVFEWLWDPDRTSNDTVVEDTYVYILFTLYNVGTLEAENIKVYFKFDGKSIGTYDVGKVTASPNKPSTIVERKLTWLTPEVSGSRTGLLEVYVEPENDISHDNNGASVDITIIDPTSSDKPDLVVSEIVSPESGDDVYSYAGLEIKARVGNIGYRGVASVEVILLAGEEGNEDEVDSMTIDLSAQEVPQYFNVRFYWLVELEAEEDGRIIIQVDPDDDFDETDETTTSNQKYVDFTVQEARPEDHPDLSISDVKFVSPNGSYMTDNDTVKLWTAFPVTFHIYVKNYGNMPCMNVPIEIWWGENESWMGEPPENGEHIATVYISYIGGKVGSNPASKTVVYTWSVEGPQKGQYFFTWMIDQYHNTPHFNESLYNNSRRANNDFSFEFWVSAVDIPDPTITGIRMEYASNGTAIPDQDPVYYGSNEWGIVDVIITLENKGDVGVIVSIQVYDNYTGLDEFVNEDPEGVIDSRVFTYKNINIAAGAEVEFTHEWEEWMRRDEDDAPHEFYVVIVGMDSEFEMDNGNNELWYNKTVANRGEPDLTVGNFVFNPTFPKPEDAIITFIVPIQNIGSKIVTDSFYVRLGVTTTGDWIRDNSSLNQWEIDQDIAVNDVYVFSVDWPNSIWSEYESGEYDILAMVDYGTAPGRVLEEDEDNNEKTVTVKFSFDAPDIVLEEEDLDISNNAWEYDTGAELETVLIMNTNSAIKITVHNNGNKDIEEIIPIKVNFTRVDETGETAPVTASIPTGLVGAEEGAEEGGSETVTIYWTPPEASEYIATWRMDVIVPSNVDENPFKEKDLTNQQPFLQFRVIQDLPDIVANDVYLVNATTASVNLEHLVYANITNSGPVAVANVTVSVNVQDGPQIDDPETINGTIEPGATRTVIFYWTPVAEGTFRLRVVAEATDITELDDDNNVFIGPDIEVLPIEGIELTIRSADILVAPNPGIPKSEVTIQAFVTNAGDATATTVIVQMNVGGKSQSKTIDSIGPGFIEDVTFTWTPEEEGDYTIAISVDPEDTIEEFSEDNNGASIEFLVEGEPQDKKEDSDPTMYIIAAVAIGIGSAAAILFLMRKKA